MSTVVGTIVKACEAEEHLSPILKFSDFHIEKMLGQGQQGVVFKITNSINQQFALKFYHPTDTSDAILKESIDRFINEINILAKLKHRNIVKIYTGGFAKWDNNEQEWEVDEGFETKIIEKLNDNEFYYYIMEFIEGYDLTYIFPELSTKELNKKGNFSLNEKLNFFESLIAQISEAMTYYHEKNITHKDIKPENIRYSIQDSTFIIVDFGFARHLDSRPDKETIPNTDYIDFPSIENNDYEKNDMGQFTKMLAKILPIFQDEYLTNRYAGLEAAINKGQFADLQKRFGNMQEFYCQIRQYFFADGWRFQLKLDEFLTPNRFGRFNSKVRIPVSGSILLTKEVIEIIDTPQFQRLRGVRQLGPTMFVFPGANHTRFEHSLGTYFLSLKYLEQLLSNADFREACYDLDKSIKLVVLSALLHDIGHYPYSHWVEEIDKFPNNITLLNHERRSEHILNSGEIESIIRNKWGIQIDEITSLISDETDNRLLNSIINSVIDVDKLDYLIRDSIHCGVEYGRGIDTERLLDSLYIDKEQNWICLTEKGRSAVSSILSTRNIMFREIYWHKTVRACEAMFKRFFYEYISVELDNFGEEKMKKNMDILFSYSDDMFTSTLYEWAESAKNKKLMKLIQPFAYRGRNNIYKPAYIYFEHDAKEARTTSTFFKSLFECTYSELMDKSNMLAVRLKKHIKEIDVYDIILETTPLKNSDRYLLDGFNMYNLRKKRYDTYPKEIATLNDYLSNNRQAYVFCNPRFYKEIKYLADTGELQEVFGEINRHRY